jgi:SEC-C motif/HNH endonuclease
VAQYRSGVPRKLKQRLVDEAGGKCANPGCSAYRTQIHHIKEWAVYATHDEKEMIAICPTCHDAVHHGSLEITDQTLRRWKRIKRVPSKRDHVYVEPGDTSKLLLGTIAVTGLKGVKVFELGPSTRLSFDVADGDIMLLNLAVSTTTGAEVLRVVDGHLRHAAEDRVRYDRVPGHMRVTAPLSDEFMPEWAVEKLRIHEPDFGVDGSLRLLDIEVLEPGLVRVQGVWNGSNHAVAITESHLSFIQPDIAGPLSLAGHGADSVLLWGGPITTSLFGTRDSPGHLHVPSGESEASKPARNDPCWCGSGKKFKKCHGA